MASTQSSILDAIKDVLDDLTLTGVEEIQIRAHFDDGEYEYPGLTIMPIGEEEFAGTNERDRIVYNIAVVYVVNDDADVSYDDAVGDNRQKIRQALIHQKLDAVTGMCTVLWDASGYDVKNKRNLTITRMTFRVVVSETRG